MLASGWLILVGHSADDWESLHLSCIAPILVRHSVPGVWTVREVVPHKAFKGPGTKWPSMISAVFWTQEVTLSDFRGKSKKNHLFCEGNPKSCGRGQAVAMVARCHCDQISDSCNIRWGGGGLTLSHGSKGTVSMVGGPMGQSTWWKLVAHSHHSQPGSRES